MFKEGKPIIIPIEGFHVPYETPPLPPLIEIDGHNLPKKQQKWVRPILPSDEDVVNLTKSEKSEIIKKDLLRRINGYWFMNNGEPTYITGSHYFTLTHWYMAAVNEDGYPEYRNAARLWFYVKDIADKDEDCFGLIMMCQKRFGKTEYELADIYNKATRGGIRVLKSKIIEDKDCLFGMQSLTATEAKNNLFKTRLMRSHTKIQRYLKPESNETNSKREIVGELTFKGTNIGGGKYKDALNNVIDHRPTLVSAYQGKRPRQIFIDEPGSIEEMDLIQWWTTVKQQLALGTKAFGKAFLPTTLESMSPRGADAFKKIWDTSDPEKRDDNGRTESGLYRYFKPQYLGREDFIDEYGNDLIDAAKKFRANELANATPEGQRKIKRQYPETEEEAFDLDFGGQLTAEAIGILKARLKEIRENNEPRIPYNIYEYKGEVTVSPAKDETDKTVVIFENPKPDIDYRVSVDGTGTDKRTSDSKASKKSRYTVIVSKLVDPDATQKSYCDVAEYSCEPLSQEECFRVTLLLTKYYNKYGKCRILPEGNIGTAPAIVGYFENNGCLQLMLKQPKYLGSDNKETLNKFCFYRDKTVMDTQLYLLNVAVKMYGHNLNSSKLIVDLIATGTKNTDLGSAWQGCLLTWGGFAITEKPQKKAKSPVKRLVWNDTLKIYEYDNTDQRWDAAIIEKTPE